MYVTHTWRYSQSQGSDESLTVKDAVVQMYINDKFVENLTYTETETVNYYEETVIERTYCSTVAPKSGDRVKFIATSDKYGTAEAEVTVPVPVPVDTLEYTLTPTYVKSTIAGLATGDGHYDDLYGTLSMDLSFTDPADVDNYYFFNCKAFEPEYAIGDVEDPTLTFRVSGFDYDIEPLFAEHISAFEALNGGDAWGCTFFTDKQISGRTYPLHVRFTNLRYWAYNVPNNDDYYNVGLNIYLYSISESYYKWMLYKWQKENGIRGTLSDVGLGEALLGYSNVSTGAGLVAARSVTPVTLSLAAPIKQAISEAKNNPSDDELYTQ
jgi:hypothetical protein